MPGRCWFVDDALTELLAESRRWQLRETGGALLGWCDEDEYVVARVLGPGPDAKHGLSSFEPDGPWQAERGAAIYKESGRTISYLGDWHTHPRGIPRPSSQDKKTAREIADDPDFRSPRPLYAIAGRSLRDLTRRRWQLVMYVWTDDGLDEIEVTPYTPHQGPNSPK